MVNYKKLWKYIDGKLSWYEKQNIEGLDIEPLGLSLERRNLIFLNQSRVIKGIEKYQKFRDLLIRTRKRKIRLPDKIHIFDSKGNIVGTFDTTTNKRIYKLDEVSGKLYVKDERKI